MTWTIEKLKLLKKHYPLNGADEYLIKNIGLTKTNIYTKASILGIKKNSKNKRLKNKK